MRSPVRRPSGTPLAILPLVSLVALLAGWWLRRREDRRGLLLTGLAAIPLLAVGLMLVDAVASPIVPGLLAATPARFVVIGVAAAASGGLIGVIRRVLEMTSLDA